MRFSLRMLRRALLRWSRIAHFRSRFRGQTWATAEVARPTCVLIHAKREGMVDELPAPQPMTDQPTPTQLTSPTRPHGQD
eukprot:5618470-Alexandrium_andersonii.AAC.1